MENILLQIIDNKKREIAQAKEHIPYKQIEKVALSVANRASMAHSIQKSDFGIIAEFKRRSPSKGWIFETAQVEEVVPSYSKGGAAAISVLTDSHFFGGSLTDLDQASSITNTPLLRKDFIVDEYQILQAKLHGASAILLIASALSQADSFRLAQFAKEIGLDVLLEIHTEHELAYVHPNIDMVGINNRNLKTFKTDIEISFQLAPLIPNTYIKVAESGLSEIQMIHELKKAGFQGFLMGENFMKTLHPGETLHQFISALHEQ